MMRLRGYLRFTALIAVLTALFIGVGYLLGGKGGVVLALIFAAGMNVVSYFYSDKIVLKMYRAQEASREHYAIYHEQIERLAEAMQIPKPALYVMDAQQANAFATGRNPENSAVCITTGLLQHLNKNELEGVLAHELAHIKNRDVLLNTVAATIVSAISMIGNILFWNTMLGGRGRGNGNAIGLLVGMFIAPLAATLLQLAISRSREFAADYSAAQYTNPSFLASALQRIEHIAQQAPMQGQHQGTAHLFIQNPFRLRGMQKLFSTHPPTEERVERLQRLA